MPLEYSRTSTRYRVPGGNGHTLAAVLDSPSHDSWIAAGNNAGSQAPLILFSHCFTCNKDYKATVKISRHLVQRGIAVMRFDMTGLGGSDGDFSQTNFQTNVRDIDATIRFLQQQGNSVDVLMGHSFGGAASMAVAASGLLPNLRGIITMAAPSDTVHLGRLLDTMNPAIQSEGQGTVRIGGFQWTITRQMLDDFAGTDLSPLIQSIRCPALLIHSLTDETVSFEHADRIADQLPGAISRLTFPDADHLFSSSNHQTSIADTIAGWLQAITKS
ncbi:MAG: alpha/beta fold hydrolase [Planctomycetota bacterium]